MDKDATGSGTEESPKTGTSAGILRAMRRQHLQAITSVQSVYELLPGVSPDGRRN